MWRLIWFFAGWHRIRVTGASPQWILGALAKNRVAFERFERMDEFCAECVILRRSLPQAKLAAQKAMCEIEILKSGGFPVLFAGLRKRPLFPVLLAIAGIGATLCTRFVWFYEVQGNERVSSEQILRELHTLGVGVGTFGPSIQPQWLKNHMLSRIPELQWLTVTQNGGCAVVTVRERADTEPIVERKRAQNVLACRGGVLTRVSVLNGNALCKVGDVVQEGQLLVSAYTDWGYKTQVSSALAEIYAQTGRRASAILPDKALFATLTDEKEKSVFLTLGRRRWKIFGKGGFSTQKCDIMTQTYKFVLPGGYSLPIAIEIRTQSVYDTREIALDPEIIQNRLEKLLMQRTQEEMIAGVVEEASFSMQHSAGAYRLYASMRCEEMIARMVDAEIFKDDGNAND